MKRKYSFTWLLVLFVLIAINLLASFFHTRLDLTNEKRFTISEPVKNLLKKVDQPVHIYIFLKGDLPAGFKMLSRSAQELLQEFKEYSHGNIQYEVVDPESKMPGTNVAWADTLQSFNIVPINLKVQLKAGEQSQYIYPAAAAMMNGRLKAVHLYPGVKQVITPAELNNAEALFEFKFADAIQKLADNTKPMIAYAIGNGEPTGANTYDLVENILHPNYDVFTVDLKAERLIPNTFKALILVKPTIEFSDSEKLKLDQYVMHGGKLLVFIDRLEAEMDSLQLKNQVVAYDRNLNLQDLFFKYGARVNPDLIMDLQSDFLPFDVNNSGQFELLHWNYFPLFQPNQQSIITKNVGLVSSRFVNSIDTVQAVGIKKTVLLSSSDNARTIETPALISGSENRNAPEDAAFQKSWIIAGVLLEGRFTSLYKNRVSRETMDTLSAEGRPFVSENAHENKMIIVSDGDIPLNSVYQGQPLPMGVNPYTIGTQYEYQFANRQFVENCIEYLVNDGGLMQAKSKDYKLRLLDPKKVNEQKTLWQWINFAVPVILILLFALFYQWWRRKRYNI